MPARIQPNRPYYPRLYLPHPRQQNVAPASARAGRGGAGGAGGLFNPPDAAPTGSIGGDIIKAIGNTIQQNRQNALANRLMNTENPPRAAWVGGATPAAGVPTTGTAPTTGGVQEMRFQQQLAADEAAKQQQELSSALQKAKIASTFALTRQRLGKGGGGDTSGGNARRWQEYLGGGQQDGKTGKAGKQPKYQSGDIDPMTDPAADKFQIVQADFDAKYGKGAYSKIAPNLPNATIDDKGNYVITNPKGDTVMTLPPDQAQYWLSRYNAASVRSGQQPIFTEKFPSANPNSGKPAGTVENPYKPSNQLEARSLPYNAFFIDPNTGQIGQKLQQEKQPSSEKKTSQVDTGDQGGQSADTAALAEEEATDQGATGAQGDQLAFADTGDQGERPDMSTGVGSDTETGDEDQDVGSASLADAIKRTRAQNQLLTA